MALNLCGSIEEFLACNPDADDAMWKFMMLRTLGRMADSLQNISNGEMLGALVGANFNSTADQPISMNSMRYTITKVLVTNPSVSLTTAVGGMYDAPAKGGNQIVANTQTYTLLVMPTHAIPSTLTTFGLRRLFTQNTIYLSLTTPQGAPATADLYVFGNRLD